MSLSQREFCNDIDKLLAEFTVEMFYSWAISWALTSLPAVIYIVVIAGMKSAYRDSVMKISVTEFQFFLFDCKVFWEFVECHD